MVMIALQYYSDQCMNIAFYRRIVTLSAAMCCANTWRRLSLPVLNALGKLYNCEQSTAMDSPNVDIVLSVPDT